MGNFCGGSATVVVEAHEAAARNKVLVKREVQSETIEQKEKELDAVIRLQAWAR